VKSKKVICRQYYLRFGFTKLQWLQLTGKVGKSINYYVKFPQYFTYQSH